MNSKINNKINTVISAIYSMLFGITFFMAITTPLFGGTDVSEYAEEVFRDTGLKIEQITVPQPVPYWVDGSAIIEARVNPCGNVEELSYEGNSMLAQAMIESVKKWRFESRDSSYIVRIPVSAS